MVFLKIKNTWQRITQRYPIIKNKYLMVTIAFLVWVGFFDSNNLIKVYQRKHELNAIQEKKIFYRNEIQEATIHLSQLHTDTAFLIRMAREKYKMKRDNEDVFIIDSAR